MSETTGTSRLTGMLTARVPAGFGDQIREAARAEGVRPGALIRNAISERIKRAGATPVMTPEDRAEIVGVLGEGFAQNIERSAVDPEFRAELDRKIGAARFAFMDRLISAHEHLTAYIQAQADRDPGEAIDGEADLRLVSAYADIDAAREIQTDLGRIFLTEGSD